MRSAGGADLRSRLADGRPVEVAQPRVCAMLHDEIVFDVPLDRGSATQLIGRLWRMGTPPPFRFGYEVAK